MCEAASYTFYIYRERKYTKSFECNSESLLCVCGGLRWKEMEVRCEKDKKRFTVRKRDEEIRRRRGAETNGERIRVIVFSKANRALNLQRERERRKRRVTRPTPGPVSDL